MPEPDILLTIEGAVDRPVSLTIKDLEGVDEADRVVDVSRFQPTRRGDGVTLASLLAMAGPKAEATYVTLHADRDNFHVSVPLDALRDQGVVVYKVGRGPLSTAQGGPIRLILRSPTASQIAELDECANVKYLNRIELTTGRGRDNRPKDAAEHAALHANPVA